MKTKTKPSNGESVTVEINPENRSVKLSGPAGHFGAPSKSRAFAREALDAVEGRSRSAPGSGSSYGSTDSARRERILATCERREARGEPALTFNGKPCTYEEARDMPMAVLNSSDQAKSSDVSYRPDLAGSSARDSEDRDASKFSIGRLIRSQFNGHAIDGVERELCDEGNSEARSAGLKLSGYMISSRAFESVSEHRDLTATGGTGGDQGGMTIGTRKNSLLGSLFNSLFIARAGATVLDGLTGNLDLPRIIDGSDPAHKAENATADEHSPTMDDLSLSPNRLPTYIDVSNQLLLQSSDATLTKIIERHLRQKLLTIMEAAFINGDGTNKPTGILGVSGIGDVALGTDGAAPTHADLVNLIKEVSVDNALDGSSAFAINSATAAKLKTVAKIASTDSMTLLDDRAPNILSGYPFFESNAIPSNLTKGTGTALSAIIFGSWADFYIGQWSGIEILVDRYTKQTEGMTRIHAAVYYDGGPIRPQSFAAIKDCDNS